MNALKESWQDSGRTVVIIPTYNERGNIGRLIDCLEIEFSRIPRQMHILVVDDNSPDGTSEVARDRQRAYDNVHVITGQKQGLGAAYIRGMRYAIEQLGAEAVLEMDADFSHRPEDVGRLVDSLEKGADFVIGSRYVAGGTIPRAWGLLRRANSLFGNLVARYGAGLHRIRDCTAGFRAIRTTLLERAGLHNLDARGYGFQIALLSEAIRLGARIEEIPVQFIDRAEGESKLGLSDIIEFFAIALKIRLRKSATFLKFCVVGGTGVIVNLGVFTPLLAWGLDKYLASPIAIEASIISNFILNSYWTFEHRRTGTPMGVRGLQFNLVSILALGISYTSFIALSLSFPQVRPELLQALSIVPGTGLNYVLNSVWTFRHRPELN